MKLFIIYTIIIIILIITIIYLKTFVFKDKPKLFLYWEGNNKPPYIDLCIESIYKHCSKSFDIIFLDDTTIYNYLPEVKNLNFNKLKIAQKVDYYRIALLNKYGGVYMDTDILVLKDPIEITNQLNKYDFVGFGCTGNVCKYGYGKPSNWILCSKKNTILMKNILNNYLNKLNEINNNNREIDYHEFGKYIIWEELDKLIKTGYTYYHYPNTVDGTRDKNGDWVTMGRLFSDKYIEYDDPNNLLMVVLYNSDLDDFDKKYRNMSKEELLKTNINFVKYYNKSKLN